MAYVPAPDAERRVLEGRASYYSDSLAGNLTANGERYDPRAMTAAHRSLAFGTHVRVTRTDTQRSVVVRINDRGPFGEKRRIIDLSRAAATELGMLRAGVVDVEVEVLEPVAAH
ncbi:MAG TPA: septal ring lytic transglycosylase RlpA family protein [Polyangiaceae bacterium]|nr:septal ring lytic transglycosylase RlpA family protein [Polyangiaceae bacterium]